MAISPTARQSDLLRFIQRYTAEHGRAPTVRQMMAGIGSRSIGATHDMIEFLWERGHLARGYYRDSPIHCLVNMRGESFRFIPFPDLRGEIGRGR